jgi:hypothetical protein
MEYLGPGTVAVRAAIRAADSAVQIHGGPRIHGRLPRVAVLPRRQVGKHRGWYHGVSFPFSVKEGQ